MFSSWEALFSSPCCRREACRLDEPWCKAEEVVKASPQAAPGESGSNGWRHLVLNFDINKTVLMTDSATGKTARNVVNEELSSAAWGVVTNGKWCLEVEQPASLRPTCPGGSSYVSYAEFLLRAYEGPENKRLRSELKASFTKPGSPGESWAHLADGLTLSLENPGGVEVRLIPAFFELLLHLKRMGRSFTICFRTFGDDLKVVARELTDFCEGRHPRYVGVRMDGSDGEADYRLFESDVDKWGTFHRRDGVMSLVIGTTEQPGEGAHRDAKDRSLAFYDAFEGVRVLTGIEKVSRYLWDRCSKPGTLGVRDDYAHWKSTGSVSEGGKVFFFDPNRDCKQHAVMFDDNIEFDDFYIAQPVSLCDLTKKHFVSKLLQTHMCKALPLEAIASTAYFVKNLERLEEKFERSLRSRERLRRIMRAAASSCRWKRGMAAQLEHDLEPYDAWAGLRSMRNNVSMHDEDSDTC